MFKFKKVSILSLIKYTGFVLLVVIALLSFAHNLSVPKGFRFLSVMSGSMEPAIKMGSVVVVQPKQDYQPKEVITFKEESERSVSNPKRTKTHRIVEAKNENDKVFYTTKGDANDTPDGESVDKDLVLGKVIFSIPYLGYLVSFAKTQTGLIALIIIPGTIIIYSELTTIVKEVKAIFSRYKQKDKSGKKKESNNE